MKLGKIENCLEALDRIFKRDLPWDTSVNICDCMELLQSENYKYQKLKNKILQDHYTCHNNEGRYIIKGLSDAKKAEEKFDSLNNQDIIITKKKIPKFQEITPTEMSCLRELFEFE